MQFLFTSLQSYTSQLISCLARYFSYKNLYEIHSSNVDKWTSNITMVLVHITRHHIAHNQFHVQQDIFTISIFMKFISVM